MLKYVSFLRVLFFWKKFVSFFDNKVFYLTSNCKLKKKFLFIKSKKGLAYVKI